ncbi:MAG: trypsin-like peptidase domain-containing protein [Anaerolineales bacterium]|nr:trypsin-like peptidase domain-containing protein [Anaerolineales bacterium]
MESPSKQNSTFKILLLLAGFFTAGIIGALVGGLAVYLAVWSGDRMADVSFPESQEVVVAPVESVAQVETWDISTSITDTIDQVGPAVVTVVNTQSPQQSFFGTVEAVSSGSGAIFSKDGYIVTNNHVVENAESLSVILADGTELPAELVGVDTFADIAVVKVEGEMPAVMEFGNSDLIKPGETVIAIGSPLGDFKNTVTVGVVSAVDREIDTSTYYQMEGLIQTDAAINSGNSGGPLVNLAGQIIGINTLVIRGQTGAASAEGLGFSIPSNVARAVVGQIIEKGYVSRPALGISWGWITPTAAQRNNLPVEYGAYITEVGEGTPADNAGLQAGDIITKLDDQALDEEHPFVNSLFEHSPGDTIVLTLVRDGTEMQVNVTLGDRTEL